MKNMVDYFRDVDETEPAAGGISQFYGVYIIF